MHAVFSTRTLVSHICRDDDPSITLCGIHHRKSKTQYWVGEPKDLQQFLNDTAHFIGVPCRTCLTKYHKQQQPQSTESKKTAELIS
jgi:hypothetical protein